MWGERSQNNILWSIILKWTFSDQKCKYDKNVNQTQWPDALNTGYSHKKGFNFGRSVHNRLARASSNFVASAIQFWGMASLIFGFPSPYRTMDFNLSLCSKTVINNDKCIILLDILINLSMNTCALLTEFELCSICPGPSFSPTIYGPKQTVWVKNCAGIKMRILNS